MSTFLESLDFEVTDFCNEKCIHCYRLCNNYNKYFLTNEDIDYVLQETKSFSSDNQKILLTGGEFFLNPEWRQIVKTVSDSKRRFAIYTNGTLIGEQEADYLSDFVNKGLEEIQISLYGMNNDIHDSITHNRGSCEKSKRAIHLLQARNIPVFVSICAMQANKDEFYNVMKWCDENNIRSSAHLEIFGTSDYANSNGAQNLSKDDLEKFFKISMENNGQFSYIWKCRKDRSSISNQFYYHTTRELCIGPNGDIYPEVGWYRKLGNIKSDNLRNVFYNNDFINLLRKYEISQMQCAECTAFDFCNRYTLPHVNANNGEPGKYNKSFCDYIHLIKDFSERLEQKEEITQSK